MGQTKEKSEEEKEEQAQRELFKVYKDKDLPPFLPPLSNIERILDELEKQRGE
jgi:hypothetical protein